MDNPAGNIVHKTKQKSDFVKMLVSDKITYGIFLI